MLWIAVDAELAKNNKIKALRNALRLSSTEEAIGFIVKFWGWCQSNADETGLLRNCTAQDIADAFGWKGKPSTLIAAMTAIQIDGKMGFLEIVGNEYRVHDWAKEQKCWYTLMHIREKDKNRKDSQPNNHPQKPAGKQLENTPEKPPEKTPETERETTPDYRQDNTTEIQPESTPEFPVHNLNRNPLPLDDDDNTASTHAYTREKDGELDSTTSNYFDAYSDDADKNELQKQWAESFGSPPTPEQLTLIFTLSRLRNIGIMMAAIRDAALRGATRNPVVYISDVLSTWEGKGLKTAEDVEDWKNKEALIRAGFKGQPPNGTILNLDTPARKTRKKE